MTSIKNSGAAVSRLRERRIDRRRVLVFCGGAAAALAIAGCGDRDSAPEVDEVALEASQIPEPGGEPFHSEEGRFYLVNHGGELLALYSKCTHQGCAVAWKSDRGEFACPCHGSTFDRIGVRTAGPAERPLDIMALHRNSDGGLVIDTREITAR